MPYAYFEIVNAPPPGWADRLEGVKGQLGDLRGQLSGAAQGKVDELRGRLDEIIAQVPRPGVQLPADWLDQLHARVTEVRGNLPAAAQGVADEVRARVEELRGSLVDGEQPIALPPAFQQRLDQARTQVEQVRGQLQGGAQGLADEVRRQLEELRIRAGSFDRAALEARLGDAQGRLDDLRAQIPGSAQGVVDEIKRRLEEAAGSLPTPELPAGINEKVAAIRAGLESLRGQAPGDLRAHIEGILGDVQGKAYGVFFIPGQGFRYAVLDANAVLSVGQGGGRRPSLY